MTTIRDVAKTAGVSPITVSRVVNRLANVNPETRARVEAAIKELGYVRNLAASSLRSKETYTLALILPDITNTFWTTVARGVEDAAQSDGYSVLLCNTDEDPEKFTKYLNAVIQQRVDGVMVVPVINDPQHFAQLSHMKVPTVILDRRVANWEGDSVYCDSIASAQALVQHLLSLGHTRIAIMSGPATTSTAEDRVAGYCLALYKASLPVEPRLIWRGEFRSSSGSAMTREMLASGLEPTAILATNNAIAAGVLDELHRHGKNVPGDIALVCFDELPEIDRFFPFLTSVTQPAYDMGMNATQLLLSRINASGPLRAREVVLPTRLMLRYSCGRFLKSGGAEASAKFNFLPDLSANQLVLPLDAADRELLFAGVPGISLPAQPGEEELKRTKPDRKRLVQALKFNKTDRFPCLAGRGTNEALMEAVLGHGLRLAHDRLNVLAEDAVEFAVRTGLDAIPCEFTWQMTPLAGNPVADLPNLVRQAFPAPALASQLSILESLLDAARGRGVGIYARFSSFLQNPLRIVEAARPGSDLVNLFSPHGDLENLMDMLVKHQERVLRAVCDRFWRDLCFISIQDDDLVQACLVAQPGIFQEMLIPRLKRMLTPAREHNLPIALDTQAHNSALEAALPALAEAGISILQFNNPDTAALEKLARTWQEKVVLAGGLPVSALSRLSTDELDEHMPRLCKKFGRYAGFIFSPDVPLSGEKDFPPQHFTRMLRSVQRFQRD